jgi:hypothetical protein
MGTNSVRPCRSLLLSVPLVPYVGYAGAAGRLAVSFIWKYVLYSGLSVWLVTASARAGARDPFDSPVPFAAVLLVLCGGSR